MKKLISSLLVVVMALGANTAKADNISVEEAREAAAYYMGYYMGLSKLTADNMELVYQIDNQKLGIPAAYFFNIAGGEGWVILAGTTTIDPIIGVNDEGSLNPECFPANMRWWINGYCDMVSEIQELDEENDYPDDAVWTALKTKSYKGDTKDASHKLMPENWGQGDKNTPTYNIYCPVSITSGETAITGCVATAMAQIFHYYRYPRKGTGLAKYWLRQSLDPSEQTTMPNSQLKYNFDDSAVFNYDNMPNNPINDNGRQACSDEEMQEIAHLMYACGVSVKMGYTPDGSGARSAEVTNAARKYFKYQSGTQVFRQSNSDRAFVNAIREALMQNNVLYMSGSSLTGTGADAAGHAWVCCGYYEVDTNRYFMNWGWDGGSNGFYNLGKNNMPISGQGYNFNQNQEFISGMVPPDDSNRFLGITEIDNSSALGMPYPNPAISSITIPYQTNNATELVIYNIEGRLVATYRIQPGEGEVQVNVNAMPAGVYIYRMNTLTGKFMVK